MNQGALGDLGAVVLREVKPEDQNRSASKARSVEEGRARPRAHQSASLRVSLGVALKVARLSDLERVLVSR